MLSWFKRKCCGEGETAEEKLEIAVKHYVELGFTRKAINNQVKEVFFDYKYKDFSTSKDTPSQQLTKFHVQAVQGNNAFVRDPLYRALRVDKDVYHKSLIHILKRNER